MDSIPARWALNWYTMSYFWQHHYSSYAFPKSLCSPTVVTSNLTAEILSRIDEHYQAICLLGTNIDGHRQAIIHYYGRFNVVKPAINVLLPMEILAEIFKNYMLICTPQGYHTIHPFSARSLVHTPYEWLKVAHVCRYWRSIALSYPVLFEYVVLS